MPQAVCCSDHMHCCPRGFKCSPDGKTCSSGAHTLLALSATPSKTLKKGFSGLLGLITGKSVKRMKLPSDNAKRQHGTEELLDSVICPDGASQCPDGNTCCKLSSGQWGCCPLPQAVCCSDGVHCCPNGYTCDVSAGTCSKGSKRIPMLKKIPALKSGAEISNVICPDGQSECPDGNTCCKLSSGQWGCCPLPQAVCCSDGVHCCPNGYTCDVSSGTCSRGSESTAMLQKISALKKKGEVSNVICPDGQSECPDGNTCCKLSSGQYGCCPLPQAVCCSDGVHCCPNGYTCDVSAGTCSKGSKHLPMLPKIPASKKKEVRNVICPDGQSECPDGNTCCKLSSGQYGCCPLPNAVCCSDGEHCCPNGYTCDVSAGTCNKGSKRLPMLPKIPASKKKGVRNVICPDGQSECPDGNTCCKLSSGEWGCCPLPQAVCCSDGVHCCPNGYTCNVSSGTCSRGSESTAILQKISTLKEKAEVSSVICPDGQSECPDGNTCCKLSSGQWGCCPLPQAVCCSDGVHCCPNGYTCDVSAGTCSKGSKRTPMLPKIPASKIREEVRNVICPDGQSECPDGNTCCKLSSGQYGCCPLPNAVCCSDREHCCPNGYTCDVSAGTCSKGSKRTPMLPKIPASKIREEVRNVICPDGQSECPDGNTCCKLSSGQYGCCPLPNAVCCSDREHCCPNGYTCDVSAGTCSKGSKRLPMLPKIPASKKKEEVRNIICPDGQSECPDGNTCCKLSSGEWGCCPLPQAVCCSDGVHCCPNGYTCDVSSGTCSRGSESTAILQKISALKEKAEVSNVVCPDGQSECPDGNTCCKLSSGQWGCCPLPQAVCCSDGVHCCPNGYTCNVANGTCSRGSFATAMLEKIATLKRTSLVGIVCPDGQSECPDGTTCCKLSSGGYGCCPLPQAVCCSDGVHCCPNGYTCNVANGTCSRGSFATAMLEKIATSKRTSLVGIVCPDGQSECPDGTTCCKLSSGGYGCCPLPQAVCCSDGVHCCPNGYTCNLANGTCSRGSFVTAIYEKIPTSKRTTFVGIVCPDGESECPDGTTCCKLSSGGYGCCPLPQAVCCSDGVHCCPNGYTCNVANGTCSRGSSSTAMFEKIVTSKRTTFVGIVCPDGESECPDGTTCCKLSSGGYGCCPLPQAVCCSDGVHCCPNGYTCNLANGTCSRGSFVTAIYERIPTSKRTTFVGIVCPDGESECPDGTTCCKLSSGGYGCCPLPQAVCCSDGVHCCPNGYTCNLANGTCSRGSFATAMLAKIATSKRTTFVGIVCPDGESQCPDGTTCCKLSSGGYGCCPLPQAVCCSDGVHCCPNGYTCNVANGTCSRGSFATAMLEKIATSKMTSLVGVVCPDGQSECPDGTTCCKLSSGGYGCCPLPQAVCCSDGVHCCPNGYTCNVANGTCSRGSFATAMLEKIATSKRTTFVGIVCPDGQSECPDGTTCCKLSSGGYGCCPLPQAVCCSDGVHCCPNGYTCNVANGTCSRGSLATVMFEKIAISKRTSLVGIVCPDGESQCPDGTTCCKLSSGGYGCCPLPQAVCCSDGVHCCPNGYKCNLANGTCSRGSSATAMFEKIATSKRTTFVGIICPDGESQCPDGTTCCKLSSGGYGCCPLPQAVCCSDGVHCCPNGYTCNLANGTCSRGSSATAMFEKIATSKRTTFVGIICPDGESQCPDGSTCCKLSSGGYGCCPLPQAVCCSDGVHCCPNGYTCDVSSGTCNKDSQSIAMFQKVPASKKPADEGISDGVVCPDRKYQCPKGSTCCKLPSGTYGCCPLEKAVCCSDNIHCCPHGYVCDVEAG